jgi:hypothetical protein
MPLSVLVGHEEVTPLVGLTGVDKDVRATSLFDFELWWDVLEATPTWAAVALDEDAVSRTVEFAHCEIIGPVENCATTFLSQIAT